MQMQTKPRKWTKDNIESELEGLIKQPPLNSVVAHIEPEAAQKMLEHYNEKNRPLSGRVSDKIKNQIIAEDYEITGDTIKFSKEGQLLDGQHRLKGCASSGLPIISHVVFGLDTSVFDVIDQGKKRTAGDVLALYGIPDYTVVAAAVSWVVRIEKGLRAHGTDLSTRQIRKLATGSMKKLTHYIKEARLINQAYGYAPSQILGLLYVIGKKDHELALRFAHEWVHGAKIGRNENFIQLSNRLISLQKTTGNHISGAMKMALFIITFNYWNANEVAHYRALTWRTDWRFPQVETDANAFRAQRNVNEQTNTSLVASQIRVAKAMQKSAKNGVVTLTYPAIAKAANIHVRHVPSVISALLKDKAIFVAKKKAGVATSYRIGKKIEQIEQRLS